MKSKILAESLQTANKIKFSNDWKYMAGCNNDSKIFVWSFPSYELIDQIDFSENIRDWAISKDSIVVITAQDTQYQKMAISSQIHYYQFSSKDIQSKQGNNLRSIIFTQDSNHIAIGELNRTLPDSPNAIQMYSLPAMEKNGDN